MSIDATRTEPRTIALPAGSPIHVTLCGSSRFKVDHIRILQELTMAGFLVIPLGLYGHPDGLDMDGPEKAALDRLHLRKIDIADVVYVVNKDGYIGKSTRNEILYAVALGKRIVFLEPMPPGEDGLDVLEGSPTAEVAGI